MWVKNKNIQHQTSTKNIRFLGNLVKYNNYDPNPIFPSIYIFFLGNSSTRSNMIK